MRRQTRHKHVSGKTFAHQRVHKSILGSIYGPAARSALRKRLDKSRPRPHPHTPIFDYQNRLRILTPDQVRQGHADYVRTLAASPSSSDTWLSGSYDHTVRMWDTRQPKGNVLELSHGAPVEACLFLPGGGLCVSAGGNEVKVSRRALDKPLWHRMSVLRGMSSPRV